MYHTSVGATALGTTATLPFTGLNVVWAALAGFALLAAGAAIRRIAPRHSK